MESTQWSDQTIRTWPLVILMKRNPFTWSKVKHSWESFSVGCVSLTSRLWVTFRTYCRDRHWHRNMLNYTEWQTGPQDSVQYDNRRHFVADVIRYKRWTVRHIHTRRTIKVIRTKRCCCVSVLTWSGTALGWAQTWMRRTEGTDSLAFRVRASPAGTSQGPSTRGSWHNDTSSVGQSASQSNQLCLNVNSPGDSTD